ncbi:MAG: S8 family peptidase [Saprospiraceae bacterium]
MPDQRELPHTFLINETVAYDRYVYRSRYREEGDSKEEKDYSFQKERFGRFILDFERDKALREGKRDLTLDIPAHVDFIEIQFFKPFDGTLENVFVQNYGLYPAKFSFFNKIILFAINNTGLFQRFKEDIQAFLDSPDPSQNTSAFRNEIKLIEAFRFFSSELIKESFAEELTYIELVSEGLTPAIYRSISSKLFSYLKQNAIRYHYDSASNTIEALNISESLLNLIIDNFDIIGKVNATRTTKITPTELGEVRREYDFSIEADESLPIIGIVDTGISDQTPLANLIVNSDNHTYDLTGTSVRVDKVEHGTAVACLGVLGNQLITSSDQKIFWADAKILSIKVLDTNAAILQRSRVIDLIRKAHNEFNIKLFTLTITENHRPKSDNEEISKYAYLLDKLAYELEILVFISVGNRTRFIDPITGDALSDYPDLFLDELSNLEAPAESINNLTIGAIADNFENDDYNGITPNKKFPAIYTRTYNFNEETCSLNKFQKNNRLFKPDIVFQGGDYDLKFYDDKSPALALLYPRINNEGGFFRRVGTSFATPLAINLAAKIIAQYPSIRVQTIKALIINSSNFPWGSESVPKGLKKVKKIINYIVGHGIPDMSSCLWSSDDEITIIKEDDITLGHHKVIPIRVPDYLLESNSKNVLELSATLCFKIDPILDNHLGYCPIHISFGIFRNRQISDMPVKDLKLKSAASWSEDYYFKAKLLSNVQKLKVNISKENIRQEENQFRIAVRAKENKILPDRMLDKYRKISHQFSLVIKIKELGKNPSGKLYSEMQAINHLQAITDIELEIDNKL